RASRIETSESGKRRNSSRIFCGRIISVPESRPLNWKGIPFLQNCIELVSLSQCTFSWKWAEIYLECLEECWYVIRTYNEMTYFIIPSIDYGVRIKDSFKFLRNEPLKYGPS